MKKILSLVLVVMLAVTAVFAYEPTKENAIICKYDILPEECYSYEIMIECLKEQEVLVAPNFNKTTYNYVEGFYLNLEYFRDEFKSFIRHAMDGKGEILYDLATGNMNTAVNCIPFVTYENFMTLTYDEMFDMYCEYSKQVFQTLK